MKKRGRIYVEAKEMIKGKNMYSVSEAIQLIKKISKRKFDETVEVAINLNVDTTKSDQQMRGSFVLPHGTGKSKKILAITKTEEEVAKNAGADYVGAEDMIEKISKDKWFDFDIIISTPEMMVALGKIGKILGPKGLMPNPKTGTVTTDIKSTIENIKKGMVEYKTDTFGNIHAIIGKSSFSEKALEENLIAFIQNISKNKPSSVKGTFIKNISISSTMSPGIVIDKNSFDF